MEKARATSGDRISLLKTRLRQLEENTSDTHRDQFRQVLELDRSNMPSSESINGRKNVSSAVRTLRQSGLNPAVVAAMTRHDDSDDDSSSDSSSINEKISSAKRGDHKKSRKKEKKSKSEKSKAKKRELSTNEDDLVMSRDEKEAKRMRKHAKGKKAKGKSKSHEGKDETSSS